MKRTTPGDDEISVFSGEEKPQTGTRQVIGDRVFCLAISVEKRVLVLRLGTHFVSH